MPALPRHDTPTTDGAWDAAAEVKKIATPLTHAVADAEWAWQNPEKDSKTKAAYKLPHHEVDGDGKPGAANVKACTSAIGVLNGGMGGADIPDADRHATWEHLQKHLQDAGVTDIPKLDEKKSAVPAKAARGRGDNREVRAGRSGTATALEMRAVTDENGETTGYRLAGMASVTDEPYEMADWLGSYTEVIRSGAFAKTLAEKADVRLLLNHDGLPLARTKSGTLTLTEIMPDGTGTQSGLWCEADLDPASPLVQQIRSAMTRGDLDQMSFAFRVTRQQWSPDYEQRDILEVELFDVSVVTYPANPATTASLRSQVATLARQMLPAARAEAIQAELRAGKTLSAQTMAVLQQVLDLIAAADDAVDEAQPLLADLMGVPNPDADDNTDDTEDDTTSADDGDGSVPDDDGSEPRSLPVTLFEARLRALDAAA